MVVNLTSCDGFQSLFDRDVQLLRLYPHIKCTETRVLLRRVGCRKCVPMVASTATYSTLKVRGKDTGKWHGEEVVVLVSWVHLIKQAVIPVMCMERLG